MAKPHLGIFFLVSTREHLASNLHATVHPLYPSSSRLRLLLRSLPGRRRPAGYGPTMSRVDLGGILLVIPPIVAIASINLIPIIPSDCSSPPPRLDISAKLAYTVVVFLLVTLV